MDLFSDKWAFGVLGKNSVTIQTITYFLFVVLESSMTRRDSKFELKDCSKLAVPLLLSLLAFDSWRHTNILSASTGPGFFS